MASTSTNKQPLLIDRVMHEAFDMNERKVAENTTTPGLVSNVNSAKVIVDGIGSGNDGCVIETIYTVSRSTTEYKINLYLSKNRDFLRQDNCVFIGQVTSATTRYAKSDVDDLPKILAPVPHDGGDAQLRALYIPKGSVLWAAVEIPEGNDINDPVNDAPVLGAQGGWY